MYTELTVTGGKITESMFLENFTVFEQISEADFYQGVQHEIVIQAQIEKKIR